MVVARPPAPLDELMSALWLDRRILERLLCRLTIAAMLLEDDDRRFIGRAIAGIEQAVERLRIVHADRDDLIRAAAIECSVAPRALTFDRLISHCPSSSRAGFELHRDALLELVSEIDSVTQRHRSLREVRIDGVRSLLGLAARGTREPAAEEDPGDPARTVREISLGRPVCVHSGTGYGQTRAPDRRESATARSGVVDEMKEDEALMDLRLSQVQHEAALGAVARTSQASLVDFLL